MNKGINISLKRITINFVGIRTRLITSYLILIAFIILLGVVSYQKAAEGIFTRYESSNQTNISMISKYYDLGFSNIATRASELNANETLKKYYSGTHKDNAVEENSAMANGQKQLFSVATTDNTIENLFIVTNYGYGLSVEGSIKPEEAQGFMDSAEALAFLDSGKKTTWIGDHPYLDQLTGGDYGIAFLRQYYNSKNKAIGYIVADVKKSFIQEALQSITLEEGGAVAFVTQEGKEIYYGNGIEEFRFFDQNFYEEDKEGTVSKYVDFNGERYLYISVESAVTGARVCLMIPQNQILKQADEVKQITIIIVVLACIIAALIGSKIASGIANTIRRVNEKLAYAASGDLSHSVDVKRKDEFRVLGQSINRMFVSMKDLIRKMMAVSMTVNSSSSKLTDTSEELLKHTRQINQAVKDIEQGVFQQAEDAQFCLHQMSGLAKQLSNVNEHTDQIAKTTVNTKNIVGSGMASLSDLGEKSKNTSMITQDIIRDVEELRMETLAINDVLAVINELAGQTNLLSLNASIEAARAGDAGKGFAVVAQEVRKLAEQTADSSSKISRIIERIQNKTKNTVQTVKQAEDIVASQGKAFAVTEASFEEINQSIEGLILDLDSIIHGMEQIQKAKEDALNAIESISAVSEETAAASSQLGDTAKDQLKVVEELNTAAQLLNGQANDLKDSVEVFCLGSEEQ